MACSPRPSWPRPASGATGAVDFGALIPRREALLRHVAERFGGRSSPALRRDLEAFREERSGWLPDLALFLALKVSQRGAPWTAWAP